MPTGEDARQEGGRISMADFLPWMFDGAGTALAGFAAARVRRRLVSHAASRRVRTTVFTAGSAPYMTDFYACLAAKISSARHCVYITGEGFEPSSDGDGLACMLVAAMRDALSRGVRIVRLQTSVVVSDFWHGQLRGLVTEFPHLFELWVLLDRAQPQSLSMCAIDVDDMSRNLAEMLVGLPRFVGTRTCKVAVTAVFAEGHQALAQADRPPAGIQPQRHLPARRGRQRRAGHARRPPAPPVPRQAPRPASRPDPSPRLS
jgi:hypothetical protein